MSGLLDWSRLMKKKPKEGKCGAHQDAKDCDDAVQGLDKDDKEDDED